ncbi:MAG: DnaJ domain-containing protein [Desulfobacteraceae bacterium]|nr:DnaJ domain-containing protein [Desulfobacteraceae bacterium]
MDTKQALSILNLSSDAYLDDAKTSFRALAKKYHPDKLKINADQLAGHEKMKEINLAFQVLKKVLESRKEPESEPSSPAQKKRKVRKTSSDGFAAFFKKIHKNFLKPTKTKTKKAEAKPSTTFKSAAQSNNDVKKNKTFDSVLNTTVQSSINKNFRQPDFKKPDFNKSTLLRPKQKIKNTYSQYMELKQKMRPKKKYMKSEGFSPIEKISTISPIKKS